MGSITRLALVGAVALCAPALAAGWSPIPKGTSNGSSTYTNAEVVSIDAIGRTLVIRNAKGVEEMVELDDNLAGFGDISAGDQVILSLRTGPGRTRVSSIRKGQAPPPPRAASSRPPSRAPVDDPQAFASREAFGVQVASLAEQADGVDHAWNTFRGTCNFKAANPHEGARAWFVLWEGSVRADLSGGSCRELFNRIIDLGEPVKAGMTAAEEAARRTLSPGDIREIRRRYTMDWDGWTLAPPKPLDQ